MTVSIPLKFARERDPEAELWAGARLGVDEAGVRSGADASHSIRELEERLPEADFQRIHRSYIVNLNRIEALHGNMVEVKEKGKMTSLPVGKSYREVLSNRIEGFKL